MGYGSSGSSKGGLDPVMNISEPAKEGRVMTIISGPSEREEVF